MTKYERTIKLIKEQIAYWKEKREKDNPNWEMTKEYMTRQAEDELLLELIKMTIEAQ